MKKIKSRLVFSCLLLITTAHAQIGKHGARTISTANTIVNEYTNLTANAAAGATSITVASNSLNANSRFPATLAQGDLIMIIQVQGATMNLSTAGPFSIPADNTYGAITAYNNCGNYEFAQVLSVAGGTTINVLCGLKNAYTASGHVQVVRVPRYTTLAINNSLTCQLWNGTTGGIVAVEVQNATTFSGSGSINVNAMGFRGGVETDNAAYYGGGQWGASDPGEGAPKGEGIAGFTTEYTPLNALYARGAPANAGGGGNAHNAGGGGGGNAGNLATYTGYGIPNPTYNAIWNLETPAIGGTSSSGGGRGGNSFSNDNENAAVVLPGDPNWSGDYNRTNGGMGGRPLDYSTGRLFFAGAGGSGEMNDGDAGGGGRGAGLVFIMSYGSVSGTGVINANGENGINAVATGFGFNAKDGAGGAGAGGTVVINTNGTTSGITINANGGTGGNQNFAGFPSSDAYGPGGGGGGGYIAVSSGTPTRNANGGANGTTNSLGFSEFPPKGATSGAIGLPTATFPHYHFTLTNDTLCAGGSTTLNAAVTGTIPAGVTLNWYATEFATAALGSGTSFTTPVLSSTTTYYVGFCPGYYRLPVTVAVSTPIVINTSSVSISNETCLGGDGIISGITVTGGTGTLDYEWNGNPSTGPTLPAAPAGNYTLEVTDDNGCSATAGPFTIGSSGGPVINTTAMVITNSTCGSSNGSISGITVSGGTGVLTYEWNSSPATGPNIGPVIAGTYTLEVTDGTGCTAVAGPFTIGNTGGVTINATGVTITDASCGLDNGSITGITASSTAGGLTYVWNGTITTTPTADVTGIPGGPYTLLVTDGAGCSASSGPYTVNSFGEIIVDSSALSVTSTSCGLNNGSVTGLNVSGGSGVLTYEWNGSASPGADLTNVANGSYTLEITDALGCTVTLGPYVIDDSNPLFAGATGTNVTCFGEDDGSATGLGVGGDGALTYQWIGGPATAVYPGLTAGTYSVVVTDANGCDDTAMVTITQPASINPSIAGTNTICSGQSTTLTASGTGATGYAWSTSESTASITVSPTTTTIYTVTVSNGPCGETTMYTVTVSDPPVASITGNTTICDGQSTTLTANGGGTYVWSDATTANTITVSPTADTEYFVVATNGCGSDTATVTVTIGAGFTVDAGPDQTIGLGNSAVLNATGGTTYTWSPPDGLSCTSCQSPVASPTTTTIYTVTSTNGSGCTSTDQVTVIVDATQSLFVPDIFAPNGNGVNDVLYVRGSGISSLKFRVYDRWGQKVFQTEDISQGWDGNFQGKPLDTGVFVYTLEGSFMSGESFSQKGNVTLKR